MGQPTTWFLIPWIGIYMKQVYDLQGHGNWQKVEKPSHEPKRRYFCLAESKLRMNEFGVSESYWRQNNSFHPLDIDIEGLLGLTLDPTSTLWPLRSKGLEKYKLQNTMPSKGWQLVTDYWWALMSLGQSCHSVKVDWLTQDLNTALLKLSWYPNKVIRLAITIHGTSWKGDWNATTQGRVPLCRLFTLLTGQFWAN